MLMWRILDTFAGSATKAVHNKGQKPFAADLSHSELTGGGSCLKISSSRALSRSQSAPLTCAQRLLLQMEPRLLVEAPLPLLVVAHRHDDQVPPAALCQRPHGVPPVARVQHRRAHRTVAVLEDLALVTAIQARRALRHVLRSGLQEQELGTFEAIDAQEPRSIPESLRDAGG